MFVIVIEYMVEYGLLEKFVEVGLLEFCIVNDVVWLVVCFVVEVGGCDFVDIIYFLMRFGEVFGVVV